MATPKRGPRLGAGPAHQRSLLDNLAGDLFTHGRIRTTEAKAKALRPHAEKLITKAKRGDLQARRQVLRHIRDRDVVAYLFEEIAPRFAQRPGGYTRIRKLGPRAGDSAPMALIELVEREEASASEEAIEEARRQRTRGLFGRRRRQRQEVGAPAGYDFEDLEDFEGGDEFEGLGEFDEVDEVAAPEGLEDAEVEDAEVEDADTLAVADEEGPEAGREPPSAPDAPALGEPVDLEGGDPDAGGATGKDAGLS